MKQCKKCPWRVDVDPHDIPDGYCEQKHHDLKVTIVDGLEIHSMMRAMACHKSPVGDEKMCVGWLANQLGPGNNIALRMWAIQNNPDFKLVGEQHSCFEDTLP